MFEKMKKSHFFILLPIKYHVSQQILDTNFGQKSHNFTKVENFRQSLYTSLLSSADPTSI